MMPSRLSFPRPTKSCDRALLLALDHFPTLELRERSPLLNPDLVTHRKLVLFVVGMVLFRTTHGLLHDRVSEAAVNPHHDGLVLFVAHHNTFQSALRHLDSLPLRLHCRRTSRLAGTLLRRDGFDARDVTPHLAYARS